MMQEMVALCCLPAKRELVSAGTSHTDTHAHNIICTSAASAKGARASFKRGLNGASRGLGRRNGACGRVHTRAVVEVMAKP
jgi:hypothetical protein